MPEIPELEVTCRRLRELVVGQQVTGCQLGSPFLLRTVEIPLDEIVGQQVTGASRFGKHLGIACGELWLVLHLMLAGRLHWRKASHPLPKRNGCLKLTLGEAGSLQLLEGGTRKQAALYVVRDPQQVEKVAASAIDPLGPDFTVAHLTEVLQARNRQLKGALTSARVVGLGNAYSDEVLWAAGLSPLKLTSRLSGEEILRLHGAIREQLVFWVDAVDQACPGSFPVDQKRWRSQLKIHRKWREDCPVCGATIERISYAETETNYCPGCQNGGKKLADRRLSRFLK